MNDPHDTAARRVVERPKSHTTAYFLVAIVAAVVAWSVQQPSIDEPSTAESSKTSHRRSATHPNANSAKGDLRTLFSADDYPVSAQRNGEEGTVQAQLSVDRKGQVERCSILRSSGSKALDEATCRILQRRARFTPARDVNGQAVSDTVTTPPVVWRLEG